MKKYTVTFLPQNMVLEVEEDSLPVAASAEADVPVAAAAADRLIKRHTYCCTPFAIGKRGAFISFL